MRFCEFQKKEVINVCDCKCLGNVCDLEFDEHDGCIRTIIVPGPAKFLDVWEENLNCIFHGAKS